MDSREALCQIFRVGQAIMGLVTAQNSWLWAVLHAKDIFPLSRCFHLCESSDEGNRMKREGTITTLFAREPTATLQPVRLDLLPRLPFSQS